MSILNFFYVTSTWFKSKIVEEKRFNHSRKKPNT